MNDTQHGWGTYITEKGKKIESMWENGVKVQKEEAKKKK